MNRKIAPAASGGSSSKVAGGTVPEAGSVTSEHPLRGVLLLCLGVFLFSLQDLIIKKVSGSYPLTQVVAIRSVVAFPILLWLVHVQVGWRQLYRGRLGPLVLRAFVLFLSYTAYYMAFPALPLAAAVALYFTVPLFVTAIAVPLLHEKAHPRLWIAVALGFLGVLVMLSPGQGVFEPAALLSLVSAAMYAVSMIIARKLGHSEAASVMSFFQNLVFLVGASLLASLLWATGWSSSAHPSMAFLTRDWTPMPLTDLLLVGSCGLVASAGMVALTAAYRIGPATRVTAFEYTGVLWAPLWGFLFFLEVPTVATLAGAMLIVMAGLLVLKASKT
jgi:drug/metabolite transporter (DMT)-like permease